MSTQSHSTQSLSPTTPPPLTPKHRYFIQRAVSMICAADDGAAALAAYLGIRAADHERMVEETMSALDHLVAIVDHLTGNTGNAPCGYVAGGAK